MIVNTSFNVRGEPIVMTPEDAYRCFLGTEMDIKFEARNITGRKREEFQQSATNRVEINTYDVGRTFSLSASMKF